MPVAGREGTALWRSGYELDQVHIDDLTALSERFGTPVFAEK